MAFGKKYLKNSTSNCSLKLWAFWQKIFTICQLSFAKKSRSFCVNKKLMKSTPERKWEKSASRVCVFCFHMCSPTYFDPASNFNKLSFKWVWEQRLWILSKASSRKRYLKIVKKVMSFHEKLALKNSNETKTKKLRILLVEC